MRLGGPIFGDVSTPEKWIAAVRAKGYRAAYCPVKADAGADVIAAYANAAREADVVIAEVGAWSNPISPDEEVRRKAIAHCQAQLGLAEQIGARCCVNIAGSRNLEQWDGPHPDNLTPGTFKLIVETTREIIDAVNPTRTFFTLETMPWVFPHSPESYADLTQAIDRPQFAAHLDPANLVTSPEKFLNNAAFLKQCFALLGPHIKCCHIKDMTLSGKMTVHLDEVAPGKGQLDYRTLLREAAKLDADTPILLEHLSRSDEYDEAAAYVRGVAQEIGVAL